MADVAKDNKTLLDSLPNSAKLELSKWPKPNLSPVCIVKEELKMHTLAIGDGANAVQVAQEPGGVHRQGGAQGGALPSCALVFLGATPFCLFSLPSLVARIDLH